MEPIFFVEGDHPLGQCLFSRHILPVNRGGGSGFLSKIEVLYQLDFILKIKMVGQAQTSTS